MAQISLLRKLAEKEGFEPSHRLTQPNPLAGDPLEPLEYFSKHSVYFLFLAERVGFEPTVPLSITGFQDQLLKPLGHLSVLVTHRRFELGDQGVAVHCLTTWLGRHIK